MLKSAVLTLTFLTLVLLLCFSQLSTTISVGSLAHAAGKGPPFDPPGPPPGRFSVSEPSTLLLLGSGLVIGAIVIKKKLKK